MRPVEYLRLIRQRWWVLPITAVLGFAIALATQPTPPRRIDLRPLFRYHASTVLVAKPLNSATSNVDYDRLALLATSGQVPGDVAVTLGQPGPQIYVPPFDPKAGPLNPNQTGAPRGVQMGRVQVLVTPNKISGSLTIEATAPNPQIATAASNAIGYELLMYLNTPPPGRARGLAGFYRSTLGNLGRRRAEALSDVQNVATSVYTAGGNSARLAGLAVEFANARQRLVDIDRQMIDKIQNGPSDVPIVVLSVATRANVGAIAPSVKQKASVKAGWPRLTLGAGIGFLVGVALLLLAEVVRPKIRDMRSAENAALMPAVAEISAVPMPRAERYRVVAAEEPSSLLAEAYRSLRTSLLAMWPRHPANTGARTNGNGHGNGHGGSFRPLRTLLVTSPGPGEGKSVTAVNLAATFAETGASVIVIDGDSRRPTVHRYFGGRSSPNLGDFEHGANASNLGAVLQDTKIDGVQFAASARGIGPARTVAVVKAAATAAMELADIVIIDAPPLLIANDSSELATAADAALFVVRAGRTRRDSATRAAELLRRIEARVVGVVVVGVERATPDGFYGYSSRYGSTLDARDRETMTRLRPWSRRRGRRVRDSSAATTAHPGTAESRERGAFVDLVAQEGHESQATATRTETAEHDATAPPAETETRTPPTPSVDEPWSHIFERRTDGGDHGDDPPGREPPGS